MNKISEIQYRMKLRITLIKSTDELLQITKEELKREYERRAKIKTRSNRR